MSNKQIIASVVVIIVAAFGAVYAVTRKSGNTESNTKTNTQAQSNQNTTNPSATPTSIASPTGTTTTANGCTRNYDSNKRMEPNIDFKNKLVTLEVKGFGAITISLDDKAAPKTVENFVRLAYSGFYDCLTFHRITDLTGDPSHPGRIVQGGDPEGTGMGGPGYTVPAEIGLKHVKGAIAMARTGDAVNPNRESSGSQFYFAADAVPFLDGQYTVFGQVTAGMDVLEKLAEVPVNKASGMPTTPVVIEKATVSNKN